MTAINWKLGILKDNCKVKDVIKNLNLTALRICIIVNKKNFFLGTITDGDIRRGFLKGLKISDKVNKIIKKNSIISQHPISKQRAAQIMKDNQILHLPVVVSRKVVGLHLLKFENKEQKKLKKIKNTFVIIAGGKGKRLMPYTKKIPKPMLLIRNKPILEHIVIKAKEEGFENFVIIVHHLKEKIIKYFKDGKKLGVNISYVHESSPLGTAGGLSLLNKKISKNFIVTNADVITDFKYKDLLDFHIFNKSFAAMAIKVFNSNEQYGLVKVSGIKIKGFEEKPKIIRKINCGVYAFNKNCLKFIKNNQKTDMILFFKKMKKNNKKLVAFPVYEKWNDLGIKKKIRMFK